MIPINSKIITIVLAAIIIASAIVIINAETNWFRPIPDDELPPKVLVLTGEVEMFKIPFGDPVYVLKYANAGWTSHIPGPNWIGDWWDLLMGGGRIIATVDNVHEAEDIVPKPGGVFSATGGTSTFTLVFPSIKSSEQTCPSSLPYVITWWVGDDIVDQEISSIPFECPEEDEEDWWPFW